MDALRGVVTAGRHPRRAVRTCGAVVAGDPRTGLRRPGPVTSLRARRPAPTAGIRPRPARRRGGRGPGEPGHRQRRAPGDDRAGVRALLTSRGEQVEHLTLPIFVPVSLRRGAGDAGLGNRISQMAVELPVGIADPVERLRRITAGTSRAKAFAHPSMGAVFRNRILSGVMLRLIIRKRVNLLSADIVGPRQPLSFAGVPVLEVFPLLNLMGNITLGVGALSYAGGFQRAGRGGRRPLPGPRRLRYGCRARGAHPRSSGSSQRAAEEQDQPLPLSRLSGIPLSSSVAQSNGAHWWHGVQPGTDVRRWSGCGRTSRPSSVMPRVRARQTVRGTEWSNRELLFHWGSASASPGSWSR